ncbi:hypothetical protein [Rhodovarius lipocyclicus]|uniref:hypothetical protein n=1 Tax=Rhodovarius lipocyclicus TaxID=268410 RepID=UPI001358DBD4|nr:hypothetical protein [Rhodovarius lipocyclicus]
MAEPIESTISPWMPERDPVRLAILGKLAEEASELAARANRCIIQGPAEVDPDSGRSNIVELQREIADVRACIGVVEAHFGIRGDARRMGAKWNGFDRWHDMIRDLLAKGETHA